MNNMNSGGWRFGQTSNDALAPIQNQGIDPEFLKRVASLGLLGDKDKPALEKAVNPQGLSGLLDAPGSRDGWGGDYGNQGGQSANPYGGGAMSTSEGGNAMREVSPAGFNVSMNPSAKSAFGLLSGGPLGALVSSLQVNRTAPVYDLMMPGMNGMNMGDYGNSSTEVGAPNAAQAQSIADTFARDFAGYQSGGGYGTSATMNGAPNAQQAQSIADSFAAAMALGGYGGSQIGGDGGRATGGSVGSDYGDW